ncbi:MAG TPA: hypothetical protein VFV23_13205 [Verrucomicrobiae bacterium]|nr:hypothetical protein [Verrucomicrobiae bacterium]
MRKALGLFLFFFLIYIEAVTSAQPAGMMMTNFPVASSPTLAGRNFNSDIWEYFSVEQNSSGGKSMQAHRYVEMASGLNHLVDGRLVPSKEEIDILPSGIAVATNGQHQAYFSGDIYNGVITLITPDKKVLQSRPLGLSYFDGTNSVLIAELTNSIGYVVNSNQVIYPNAFTDIAADLRYTYTKHGFEQDVILRQSPLAPESYGLNPEKSRLQILTEFFNPPQPSMTESSLPEQAGIDLNDTTLDFGQMKVVPGKAFLLGSDKSEEGVMVAKKWLTLDGRQFLVEEVPVNALADKLATLPTSVSVNTSNLPAVALQNLVLPAKRFALNKTNSCKMGLAANRNMDKGLVVDYDSEIGTVTNFTFCGDTTYYISGTFTLKGTNTFEGGTVIKYSAGSQISINSSAIINWQTASYRPAVFTAVDDDSVGEVIPGSSGSPEGYYGTYINLNGNTTLPPLGNFRMLYADTGIDVSSGSLPDISNAQFIFCKYAINHADSDNSIHINNTLFANINTNFASNIPKRFIFQNDTFYNISKLTGAIGGVQPIPALGFTNCIFANVDRLTNLVSLIKFHCDYNGFYNSPLVGSHRTVVNNYPFQTMGGGSYYLTNGASFHGAGTTIIDPDVLADLRGKTTYPPDVDSTISGDVTLGPQVPRDTNAAPDLGYHYDPIDHVVGETVLYGNTLTMSAGTALGWFRVNSAGAGLWLADGAQLVSDGTAINPCRIFHFSSVQEGNGNWRAGGWGAGIMFYGSDTNNLPQINCDFTQWSTLANSGGADFRDFWAYGKGTLSDCEFYGNNISTYAMQSLFFTNCLFYREGVFFYDDTDALTFTIQNSTFYNGMLEMSRQTGQSPAFWRIKDTAFDGTAFAWTDDLNGDTNYTQFDYNYYNASNNSWQTYPYPWGSTYGELETIGEHDFSTSDYGWQTGSLGNFYLPSGSSLIDAGDVAANQVGLYHFTTQTNQSEETDSTVDIGYHYVALDEFGCIRDSNDNNLPDWWEVQYFGDLNEPTNADYDEDGVSDLQEYLNGTDPNTISFNFSLPNQYVNTSTITGLVTVLNGVPSYYATLVDNTNIASATWNAYVSSNITINLGTGQTAHDVWIGLRGLLTDTQQTWLEMTVVLNTKTPTISITNPPDNASFNVTRINIKGNFLSGGLKQITVNDVPVFVAGTNFNALNVPLNAGVNVITAVIEDLTDVTNVASITVTGLTNADGSINDPVQLSATPITGFSPVTVTLSVISNAVPGTFQKVYYDFNGDGIMDKTNTNLNSFTHSYTNGQYFPTVTIQTTAGFFSSDGGWNSSNPNRLQVTVQNAPTLVSTLSVFLPIDIKWAAPSNVYVLSGQSGTGGITQLIQYSTNGNIMRSKIVSLSASAASGLDVDAFGNVYVTLSANNQVWKFIPDGSSFASDTNFGSGGFIGATNGVSGTTNGQFNAPFGVAVSPDGGTISVSDSGNNRIEQFTTNGMFITAFGTNGTDIGQFNSPEGLAYDSVGNLYIVDSGNNRIAVANGSTVLGMSGSNGTNFGEFSSPARISVNERGIYIADSGNRRIQCFNPLVNGVYTFTNTDLRFSFSPGFAPASVAARDDLTNELFYVADAVHNHVQLYSIAPDSPLPVWNIMTNRIAANDITGAVANFASETADGFQEMFLSLGTNNITSDINQIGSLTPVFIQSDNAEFYFEQTIQGHLLLFRVEFVKENGQWKILEF